MKSRSRILRGVAAKRVVVPRFNIDEWSKPTMSSIPEYGKCFLIIEKNMGMRETKTASVSARFFSCDTHGLAIGLLSDMGVKSKYPHLPRKPPQYEPFLIYVIKMRSSFYNVCITNNVGRTGCIKQPSNLDSLKVWKVTIIRSLYQKIATNSTRDVPSRKRLTLFGVLVAYAPSS